MLTLTRLPDWDRRLARLVSGIKDVPGVWGESDCLLTAAAGIEAVTGEDIMAPWRGRYTTEAGAARLMRKEGCENVEDVLGKFFGLPPIGRLLARRGDVGVVEQNGVLCAGFVCDRGFLCRTESARVFLPQTAMKAAFRVG
ncbi:hypothetical protein LB521_04430 [Mesorhizobium sp. BR-1-1-8]|uniref:DUF6950 family protein n=1 Tax=Mesorhizobium sp. BR-1-1-8 TaxID=2876659 RepID=UPI001CCEDB94|nr:hypothetical protein [Mesorhizobium sp. BR-1-1-8]MBZ9980393.1 hypothetical protein [Mesorhizobium sp. BR-1-1-8]